MIDRKATVDFQPDTPPLKPQEESNKPANQRRRYFRISVAVELVIDPVAANLAKDENWTEYFTLDIGGGGLSFLCPCRMETATAVFGQLHLRTNSTYRRIPFSGNIVYCQLAPDGMYRIGLEFVQLKHSARSEIIRFCQLKHAELRSKLTNYPT